MGRLNKRYCKLVSCELWFYACTAFMIYIIQCILQLFLCRLRFDLYLYVFLQSGHTYCLWSPWAVWCSAKTFLCVVEKSQNSHLFSLSSLSVFSCLFKSDLVANLLLHLWHWNCFSSSWAEHLKSYITHMNIIDFCNTAPTYS